MRVAKENKQLEIPKTFPNAWKDSDYLVDKRDQHDQRNNSTKKIFR